MKKLHPSAARLLHDINAYLELTGTNRTSFGLKAAGDGHFIARVENGKQPLVTTIDRVYAYMDKHTKAVPSQRKRK